MTGAWTAFEVPNNESNYGTLCTTYQQRSISRWIKSMRIRESKFRQNFKHEHYKACTVRNGKGTYLARGRTCHSSSVSTAGSLTPCPLKRPPQPFQRRTVWNREAKGAYFQRYTAILAYWQFGIHEWEKDNMRVTAIQRLCKSLIVL